MSRAGTSLLKEKLTSFADLPAPTLISPIWTEPTNTATITNEVYTSHSESPDFELLHVLDNPTKIVTASLYQIIQTLSQITVASIQLTSSSSFAQHHPEQQDLCIEMPPRSARDVVMKIQRMGPGKPLDLTDILLEE